MKGLYEMLLKQYFTDGLVQIAIVLSLLRIDLNSYLNTNYVNYPEVQELILGQTAVYTQTNFHRNSFENYYSGHEHLKSVESEASIILQDLRSLSRFARHQVTRQQRIATFLVGLSNGGGRILTNSQPQDTQPVNNDNVNESPTTEQSSGTAQEEENAEPQEQEEVILCQVDADCSSAVDPSFEVNKKRKKMHQLWVSLLCWVVFLLLIVFLCWQLVNCSGKTGAVASMILIVFCKCLAMFNFLGQWALQRMKILELELEN